MSKNFGKTIQEMITGFAKENVGTIVGYALLLALGTTLSVVGVTKVSAALYKSVSNEDRTKSFKYLWAIIGLSLVVMGVNFSIDRLEGTIAPTFRKYVKLKLLKQVFETNKRKYLDNILPIRYRAYVSATSQSAFYLFNSIIRTYAPNIILLVILTLFLFVLNWRYGAIFIAGVVVCICIFFLRKEYLINLSSTAEKQNRQTDGFVFDVVSSLRTVVARNTIDTEMESINKKINHATDLQVQMNHNTDNLNYLINLSVALVIFIIMSIAISNIGRDVKAVSILTALSLMSSLRVKLTGLSSTNIAAVSEYARGTANQLSELSSLKSEYKETGNMNSVCSSQDDESCSVKVEFRNVTFGYENVSIDCIQDFSWTLVPAQINVLRARSGAGKSTLAKLLLRMYKTKSGQILINNRDINDYKLSTIRSCCTFINQDLGMLNRSIYDIIVYATTATREEVEYLWDSVSEYFPDKTLESSVGRNGSNLSTGQKQVLRILNAVLSQAQVLILDEPCSGLHESLRDLVCELIQQAAYTYKRTVWLITHDESISELGDTVMHL